MTYRKEHSDGFPFYGVFKRVDHQGDRSGGFYVAETWMSLDGPRTRIARGGFCSMEEAQAWIEEKTGKGAGR